MGYQLYVIDARDKTASWPSHTEDGRHCLVFPDDQEISLVLEHPTCTTYIDISEDGELEIEYEQT